MMPQQFAEAIRKKFPGSYDEIDDNVLSKKFIEKYPVYADQVEFDDAGNKQLQQIAEKINIPSRIGRAAGVGIGLASEASGISPANILPSQPVTVDQVHQIINAAIHPGKTLNNFGAAAQRSISAFQPGYQPRPNEENYSAIGETVGNIASGAVLGAATGGLSAGAQLASEAGISGGLSALTQAQKKGKVSPIETVISAAIPGITRGAINTVSYVANAFPQLASFLTKSKATPEAFELVKNDPNFLNTYKGSVEAIAKRTDEFLSGLEDASNGLKNDFDKVGSMYGVKYVEGVEKTIPQIQQEFKALRLASDPKNKATFLPESDRLQALINLDRDLNATTGGSFDDVTKALKTKIQNSIKELPGGPRVQWIRERYGNFLDIKKKLGRALANPDQAPAILQKITEGDINGVLSGTNAQKIAGIKELEKYVGKDIFKPLRNELLAKTLRKILPGESGLEVFASIAYPKAGAVRAAVGSPIANAKIAQAIGASQRALRPLGPFVRPATFGLGLGFGQRRRSQ